ncbi:methylcrotonoyl-CoA carboxylase beta chain [Sarcoptes scabiei]|nr:methylcrotonoyl-CoA carboxylase beta chain [Sarcoptes scabiei]
MDQYILGDQHEPRKLWLAFDLSTQQLKSMTIDENLDIVHEASVHFDSDLPEFRTTDGVIHSSDDNHCVHAPVLMWIKALDICLDRLRINGLDYGEVIGVSGCSQQHGSVYWKRNSRSTLNNLNSSKFLSEELGQCFALYDSPVWMDSSTSHQCQRLESDLGGAEVLIRISGSKAYERFTGNQIAKIIETKPEVYQQTERISLISSFLASIFIGDYAPIDQSDGSGMNLLDIRKKTWSEDCIRSIQGSNYDDLIEKLGDKVVPSSKIIGNISNYYVERYGFNDKCYVVAFTGDNPATIAGMSLGPNDVAVSLGTSDTIFIHLPHLDEKIKLNPSRNGHIFCHPIDQNHWMGMICFKNGSLTRERIRNKCARECWNHFNECLESIPRGNFNNIGFYFDRKEIYPKLKGDFRFNCYDNPVPSFSNAIEIRALVEGQFLRLKDQAESLGFSNGDQTDVKRRILVSGGASRNRSVLQVLADVFNLPVFRNPIKESACYGSALIARWAGIKDTDSIGYYQMIEKIQNEFELITEPSNDSKQIYSLEMLERFRKLQNQIATENIDHK